MLMKKILRCYIIFQRKANDESIFLRRKCICTGAVTEKQHFLETCWQNRNKPRNIIEIKKFVLEQ